MPVASVVGTNINNLPSLLQIRTSDPLSSPLVILGAFEFLGYHRKYPSIIPPYCRAPTQCSSTDSSATARNLIFDYCFNLLLAQTQRRSYRRVAITSIVK